MAARIRVTILTRNASRSPFRFGVYSTGSKGAGGAGPGPELIVNGLFGSDTSSWAGTNATLSVASGAMRITNTAGGVAYSEQVVTTVVGQFYLLKVQLVAEVLTGNVVISAGTSTGGSQLATVATVVNKTYELQFRATSTTTFINVGTTSGSAAADTADFDNISVKAIL